MTMIILLKTNFVYIVLLLVHKMGLFIICNMIDLHFLKINILIGKKYVMLHVKEEHLKHKFKEQILNGTDFVVIFKLN